MKKLLIIILLAAAVSTQAQNTLVHSRPLLLNGGFAGTTGNDRIAFQSGILHANRLGVKNNGFSTDFSYDWLSKKLKGGIGIYVSTYSESHKGSSEIYQVDTSFQTYFSHLKHSERKISNNAFGLVYAPKFIIKGKTAFSPFVNLQVNTSSFHISQHDSNAAPEISSRSKWSFNPEFGFLINNEKMYVGFSMYINTDQLFIPYDNRIVRSSYQVQYGRTFNKNPESKWSSRIDVVAGLGIIKQTINNETNTFLDFPFNGTNFTVRYEDLSFGIGYSGFGSSPFSTMALKTGYDFGKVKVGYEYSGFGTINNIHTIGLQFDLKEQKDKKNKLLVK